MITRYCLVWIRGFRGPAIQVWSPSYVDLYRRRCEAEILAVHEITPDEAGEPLDQLARKYPLAPGDGDQF